MSGFVNRNREQLVDGIKIGLATKNHIPGPRTGHERIGGHRNRQGVHGDWCGANSHVAKPTISKSWRCCPHGFAIIFHDTDIAIGLGSPAESSRIFDSNASTCGLEPIAVGRRGPLRRDSDSQFSPLHFKTSFRTDKAAGFTCVGSRNRNMAADRICWNSSVSLRHAKSGSLEIVCAHFGSFLRLRRSNAIADDRWLGSCWDASA